MLFLNKEYSLSGNYKNIFSFCFLFLPFFISARQAKKIHYSFTYENMLNNFEKLRAEVFTKNFFSLIDRKTIFIDYYMNFFNKTNTFPFKQDNNITKYKVLMNFFLAENESDKKEIIKKYSQYLIMIDQDRTRDGESIFFPKNLNEFLILEFSDEQCLKIIDMYYRDKIDGIVDVFNLGYLKKQKQIENILSHMNEDILLKIVLNQKLSKKIYTYIMENFRFQIVSEINKKQGEVSRIEEVEFLKHFEIYENEKREIENTQKEEEQKKRALFLEGLNLERFFSPNIYNPIALTRLIYNNFYYDYLPIVSFFKNCRDSCLDNIAEILSYLFHEKNFKIHPERKPKEIFFKIITSPDLLEDKVKKIIFSKLFEVSENDFEDVLTLKFCYGKKEEIKRYYELLSILEKKNTISFCK